MSEDVYRRVADILDTLPNGFPSTEGGLEIRLLEYLFTPEEAELFCDLKLTPETPVQIAERTGRPLEGLDEILTHMWREKGLIGGADLGPSRVFSMAPYAIGIYEFQVERMDEEFARLANEYYPHFGKQLFAHGPALMRTIPVHQEVSVSQRTMPYDQVSGILDEGQSFAVRDCVCRKEEHLLDNACGNPLDVCLSVSKIPGIFERQPFGRAISKDDAYEIIRRAEEAGLVHLTSNVENGHSFICNCCGCCCAVLKGITKLGMTDVVNSDWYSDIDPELCTNCELCGIDVCQVDAISPGELAYEIDRKLCLGCGVCLASCEPGAIALKLKAEDEMVAAPANGGAWRDERAEVRGIDFSAYK